MKVPAEMTRIVESLSRIFGKLEHFLSKFVHDTVPPSLFHLPNPHSQHQQAELAQHSPPEKKSAVVALPQLAWVAYVRVLHVLVRHKHKLLVGFHQGHLMIQYFVWIIGESSPVLTLLFVELAIAALMMMNIVALQLHSSNVYSYCLPFHDHHRHFQKMKHLEEKYGYYNDNRVGEGRQSPFVRDHGNERGTRDPVPHVTDRHLR